MDGVEAAKNVQNGLHARAGIEYLRYSGDMSFDEFVAAYFPEYVRETNAKEENQFP